MTQTSLAWGDAKRQIARLRNEIVKELLAQRSLLALYYELVETGRITCKRSVFYRHVRAIKREISSASAGGLPHQHGDTPQGDPARPFDQNASSFRLTCNFRLSSYKTAPDIGHAGDDHSLQGATITFTTAASHEART